MPRDPKGPQEPPRDPLGKANDAQGLLRHHQGPPQRFEAVSGDASWDLGGSPRATSRNSEDPLRDPWQPRTSNTRRASDVKPRRLFLLPLLHANLGTAQEILVDGWAVPWVPREVLGDSLRSIGEPWGALGFLESSWGLLGSTLGVFGRSLGIPGRSLGSLLGGLGGSLEVLLGPRGLFGNPRRELG